MHSDAKTVPAEQSLGGDPCATKMVAQPRQNVNGKKEFALRGFLFALGVISIGLNFATFFNVLALKHDVREDHGHAPFPEIQAVKQRRLSAGEAFEHTQEFEVDKPSMQNVLNQIDRGVSLFHVQQNGISENIELQTKVEATNATLGDLGTSTLSDGKKDIRALVACPPDDAVPTCSIVIALMERSGRQLRQYDGRRRLGVGGVVTRAVVRWGVSTILEETTGGK